MAEFSVRVIEGTEWVDDAFEKLKADIKKYKLGEQPFLYDGAKYFHRAFTYYREHEFNENHNRELKTICKQNLLFLLNETEKGKVNLSSYIEQYFDFVLGEICKEYIEWDNPTPPADYAWEYYSLGYAKEDEVCYWIMELVNNFVVNIHNRFGARAHDSVIWENSTDAQAETYEDRYYDILYWLYYTYCYIVKEKEPATKLKKVRRLKTKKEKTKKEKSKKRVDKS